jgi:hypothetical protein
MEIHEVKQRFAVLYVLIGVLTLLLIGVGLWTLKIHRYLGTNHGLDPAHWSGLVGQIQAENMFHRTQYQKIACDVWKLNNPEAAEPTPCPPGQGPPAGRPSDPPVYP